MKIQLAAPIKKYFDISNGKGSVKTESCFSTNAVVHDEGGTYEGLESIETWIRQTRQKYKFSSKPINVVASEKQIIVEAEVSGTFPNSPIKLRYAFVLEDEKIQSLEIS